MDCKEQRLSFFLTQVSFMENIILFSIELMLISKISRLDGNTNLEKATRKGPSG